MAVQSQIYTLQTLLLEKVPTSHLLRNRADPGSRSKTGSVRAPHILQGIKPRVVRYSFYSNTNLYDPRLGGHCTDSQHPLHSIHATSMCKLRAFTSTPNQNNEVARAHITT